MRKSPLPFFSLILAAGFSLTGSRAAEVRRTLGTVEIQKKGSTVWSQARPKTKVQDGDQVRTGVGSETEIRFSEGHRMNLRERTTLKMESAQAPETKIQLIVGRIRTFVSKLKPQNKFEMKTPIAAASVRGTLFEMEVGENQTSRLSVLEGVVGYRDLAGLGAEVSVLKGQSVVVEPGAAPKPPEPLPAELQQGLVPDKAQQMAAFDLKAEVQREAGLASFKEFLQADAAAEMKVAQYQEGKTLIDAFGRRVRLEEYIVRPAANEFSFVSLDTREDRFDFTRFDLFAKNPLPDDISSVNLFSGSGPNSMTNWAEKTQRFSSNGGDYYREWQDGGAPVNMTDSNGNQGQLVVFSNWFTEVKGSGAPTLLSHWVPNASFLAGNRDATKTRDDGENAATGAQNIPSGYNDFEGADAGSIVGDTRLVDGAGFTNAQRLDYFGNSSVASSYQVSEGYSRTSKVLFDDKPFATASLSEILGATKISRLSAYDVPGSSVLKLQVDQYYIHDDGSRLNFLEAATLGSKVEGVNIESVLSSDLTGDRTVDVVISPSIFKKAGLLNN